MNRRLAIALTLAAVLSAPALAQDKAIVVASTTSTQDSGLFGHILPLFKAKTGIDVKVISQGTGQALDTGRRGDADVVFVHARPQEEKFVADGWGVKRNAVMYNDFVLIGPKSDPAGVKGKDIETALKAIKAKEAPFISRGDKSGTHAAELAQWKAAGIEVDPSPGAWYRAIGQGMGAALNTASASNAYVLADRGTWLSFRNRGDLDIVVEGDKRLFNQYGVMLVNPAKHAHVKKDLGQQFIDWLVSAEGQKAIADYKVNGQQLFFPECHGAGGVMRFLAAIAVVAMTSSANAADPVLLHAAGSLRGALTDVAKAFEASSGIAVQAKYGPSGTLRDAIAGGETAEVFASANMTHPASLAKDGKSSPVAMFARNRLCALVKPGFAVTPDTLLNQMLREDVKVGTSTPKADPSGDYAFEVFAKADALKAGSRAALEKKALQLTGGPSSAQPPAGRSVYGWHVAEGRADVFLTYCTNAVVAVRENPGQQMIDLPEALAVGADYGLTVMNGATARAQDFAKFILSRDGQGILQRHGFSAPGL